jgi:DNA helicase-2/ATP-dependent DNA helicase PcrA
VDDLTEETIRHAYVEEQDRLDAALEHINSQLKALQAIPRYYGIDLSEQALDVMREQSRHNLAVASVEPYFGRLDFLEGQTGDPVPLYIGKVGVDRDNSAVPLVIDWRAPVASLFYSFTGGESSVVYESPDGDIEGLIFLKRNIVVRKQILQRVVDAFVRGGENLAVADEFLLYRLGENKDNRLRDIVSTIQAEQDKIIRAAKNMALIIQGVAGSGKTTVALHRIAFLLYQYRDQIRADKMIIFAPNRMFLDYISGVLPELGVGDIRQTTFQDWALELLDHAVKPVDPAKRLSHWFAIDSKRPRIDDLTPGRWKGSVAFMAIIKEFFDRFEATYLPGNDLEVWEGCVLTASQVKDWFFNEYRNYPLARRCERLKARIERWIEMQLGALEGVQEKKDNKKKATQRLRAYLKTWPECTPPGLYRRLLSEEQSIPESIRLTSARVLSKHFAEPEDLAPLLYLRYSLWGADSEQTFHHTVIDEAQDFSPFQLALLKLHTRENSFTILGDLAQAIHVYEGIQDWEQFSSLFASEETAYFTLNRSYRSTMEIIQAANTVMERSGSSLTPAIPVFRSGEPVVIRQIDRSQEQTIIVEDIRQIQTGEIETIALLTRTEDQAQSWHSILTQAGLPVSLIQADQQQYTGGLSVLPAYLAKGLEFDAVIIADADETHYSKAPLEASLLYVACTRALHKLHIYYSGNPSPFILGTA